jgi:hypothetical protein
MNKCENIKNKLMELDFATPINDSSIEQHLETCAVCANHYQNLLELENQIADLPEHDVSDDVFAKTLAAVQDSARHNQDNINQGTKQQWASGLAASFLLVAVAGLLYNGSMSEFQGDFSQVKLESEHQQPDNKKETVWIDPMPTDSEEITVELIDMDAVASKPQMRVSSMNLTAKSKPTVNNTLDQIQEKDANLGAVVDDSFAPEEAQIVMPDVLEEELAPQAKQFNKQTAIVDISGASDSADNELRADGLLTAEKKNKPKSNLKPTDDSENKKYKDHVSLPSDELVSAVSAPATIKSKENIRREIEFKRQKMSAEKDKSNSADHEVEPARTAPVKQFGNETQVGSNANRIQAEAGNMTKNEFRDNQQSEGSSGRFKSTPNAADEYLAELASTNNLSFKSATGYWANTYLPGDSNMRWLQADLKQKSGMDLPVVRQNLQPFDTPKNSALALYLSSDHHKLDAADSTRLRLQVGIQAGEHQGGQRSALNLAVVLDLGHMPSNQDIKAEVEALLYALLKHKKSSDHISVFLVGEQGGQIIKAEEFKHGSIRVTVDNIFATTNKTSQADLGLTQVTQIAHNWLKKQDDPNATLGSSAVLLVSGHELNANTPAFEGLIQQQAKEGITFSTVAVGGLNNRDSLERLALKGQGHSRVLTDEHDAERVIKAEMLAASRAVARALRLQIRLADGVQLIDVLGSNSLDEAQVQEVREAEQSLDQRMAKNLGIAADRGEDEDGIQMVIPSFYAGDTHVVLLDVLVNNQGKKSRQIAEVNAKYKDLIYLRNAHSSLSLEMSVGPNQLTPLELNVMKNVLAHRFSATIKKAAQQLRAGNTQAATNQLITLQQLYQDLRQRIPAWKDDTEMIQDEQAITQYLQLLNGQSSIDPNQYQIIADSMSFNSWRRLLTHSP